MSAFGAIKDAVGGAWSLLVGLSITGRTFAKPQLTVHYPRGAVDNLATYRGHIELVGQPKAPAKPKCISCMMCANVCPSACIAVTKRPKPKAKPAPTPPPSPDGPLVTPEAAPPPKAKVDKTPKGFKLDYTLCSLCGLCVQTCPVDSLRFSTEVYVASTRREDFVYDLMDRLERQAEAASPVRLVKPAEEPETAEEGA